MWNILEITKKLNFFTTVNRNVFKNLKLKLEDLRQNQLFFLKALALASSPSKLLIKKVIFLSDVKMIYNYKVIVIYHFRSFEMFLNILLSLTIILQNQPEKLKQTDQLLDYSLLGVSLQKLFHFFV